MGPDAMSAPGSMPMLSLMALRRRYLQPRSSSAASLRLSPQRNRTPSSARSRLPFSVLGSGTCHKFRACSAVNHLALTPHDPQYLRDLTRALWNSHVWSLRLNIQHSFEQDTSPELYSPEHLDELCLDFHKPLAVPEGFGSPSGSGQSGSSSEIAVCDCNIATRFL